MVKQSTVVALDRYKFLGTGLSGRADAKMWNASRFCVSSLRRGHANLLCIVPILVYVLPKQVQGKIPKSFDLNGIIATQVVNTKRLLGGQVGLPHVWPCGLMDKAPDFGSGDCRFESCHGRSKSFDMILKVVKMMSKWTSSSTCDVTMGRSWEP